VLEYARNVLGISDAEHEESSPQASTLLISQLSCSLVGQTHNIKMVPGTLIAQIYHKQEATEQFHCNYGLNSKNTDQILKGGLRISGTDKNGEARIVELPGHPFYLATLFLPQFHSSTESPHPILMAFLKAAMAYKIGSGTKGYETTSDFTNK
jgi:CTP synthase (UTP-ammonia lyase)